NQRVGGITPQRLGNAHPNIVPYQVFASADGHLVVAVGNDAQFAKLAMVLGLPALAQDERYATNAARVAHRAELLTQLTPALLARSTAEWVSLLEAQTVPCSPILDIGQTLQRPQVLARGLLADVSTDAGPRMPLVAAPVLFDGQRALNHRAPPTLNQHGATLAQREPGAPAWPGLPSLDDDSPSPEALA
ncbi:CoA transferase, partial [Hydrogenophaga sp.]|uniref:CoA transferase n=1 Tax=Hydrogenophaga sp. TaxID=1904254 RepID=UPI003BB22164